MAVNEVRKLRMLIANIRVDVNSWAADNQPGTDALRSIDVLLDAHMKADPDLPFDDYFKQMDAACASPDGGADREP